MKGKKYRVTLVNLDTGEIEVDNEMTGVNYKYEESFDIYSSDSSEEGIEVTTGFIFSMEAFEENVDYHKDCADAGVLGKKRLIKWV